MAHRLRIGLTGGIASGKTTVAERFQELGIAVIDADQVARAVVEPSQPGLLGVVEQFGSEVLDAEGRLDRRRLRNLVFSDPSRRKQLEAILHPLIRSDMERLAAQASGPYLIMAVPLLVEHENAGRVNRILVVDVAEQEQLRRVMARDGSSAQQASAILAAQASRDIRLRAADDVLVNSGTISELRRNVDALHDRYLRLAHASDA